MDSPPVVVIDGVYSVHARVLCVRVCVSPCLYLCQCVVSACVGVGVFIIPTLSFYRSVSLTSSPTHSILFLSPLSLRMQGTASIFPPLAKASWLQSQAG